MLEFINSWRAVKDTAKDAYIAGAKIYGLSFGDRVIVTHAVPSYLAGWDNAWSSHMDMYVGKTGVVVQCPPSKGTYDPTGIGVCFDSDVRGGYSFLPFSLVCTQEAGRPPGFLRYEGFSACTGAAERFLCMDSTDFLEV